MTAVWALARADLRARWRGWTAIALLLAAVGGVSIGAAAGARRTDTAYSRLLRSAAASDVEIAVSGNGDIQNVGHMSDFYAAVAALPQVETVAPTTGVAAVVAATGVPIFLKGGTDSTLLSTIERPKLTAGRMFDPSRADEVVADRSLVDLLHVRVGDSLELNVVGGDPMTVTVHVVGLAVTRDNVVPVAASAPDASLLVGSQLLARLGTTNWIYDAAFIRLRPGVSIAALTDAVQSLLPTFPETGGQLFVVDERQQARKVEQAIRPEAIALGLFALIIAITSVLIVGQILIRHVVTGSANHRTLRAIGMRRSQLVAVGLTELAVVVTGGIVLAIVAAVASSTLMPIGPARFAEPHPGFALNWAIVGVGAIVLAVALALRLIPSAWHHAGESARTEPNSTPRAAPQRVLGLVRRSRVPVSTTVGAGYALDPGRGGTAVPIRSTLATVIAAVAAITAAFTFATNLTRVVDTPSDYGQAWQLSLDADFAQFPRGAMEARLQNEPGVSDWTFGSDTEATIDGHRAPAIELAGHDRDSPFPTLLEGSPPRTAEEIVLGSKTLSDAHLHLGDSVSVTLQESPTPRSMTIVGRAVFPFFGKGEDTPTGLGEGAVVLAPDDAATFNFVLVDTTGSRSSAALKSLGDGIVADGVCGQDCEVLTRQRPADIRNFSRVRATPLALAASLTVLAVATLIDLVVTSTRRRRRDFAILKSLGFTRRQTSSTVAWQMTITILLALVIALPLGVIAGRWAWSTFATRLGVAPGPHVHLAAILLVIPVALVLANVVAAVPAWRAGTASPAAALVDDSA